MSRRCSGNLSTKQRPIWPMYREEQRSRDAIDKIRRGAAERVCDMIGTVMGSCEDVGVRECRIRFDSEGGNKIKIRAMK